MIGVLSVAGLLATVLALASSPATSQDVVTRVVTITTDDIPGSYTVSWATRGGCDPSKPDDGTTVSTDGAIGSITRTVSRPAGTDDDAIITSADFNTDDIDPVGPDRGKTVEFAIAIGIHCQYDWTASFTSGLPGDEGTRCSPVPGVRNGKLEGTDSPQATDANVFTFDIVDADAAAGEETECTVPGTIKVTVGPTTFSASGGVSHVYEHEHDPDDEGYGTHTHGDIVPRTQDHVHTGGATTHTHEGEVHTHGVDSTHGTYSNTGKYLLVDPTRGAILNTTFTVTATPVKDSDDECQAVTKETEVDDNDTLTRNDDRVVVNLPVIVTTLQLTKRCEYDVVADLPAGFDHTAIDPESNEEEIDSDDFDAAGTVRPDACGDDPVPPGTDCVLYDPAVTLDVAVAVRDIYILQEVFGPPEDAANGIVDSYGNGRYTLTDDDKCDLPSELPIGLKANTSGGIQTILGSTVVELREGHFNITGAILSPVDSHPDFNPAARYALNADADPCVMVAKVTAMPDSCTADTNPIAANMVTGVDSRGRAVLDFDINCSDPMAADAMDDNGDAMDDNGDEAMPTGGEDAGEEMVDADPMGNMEDDGDAMGPPPDEPTG